jgi:hypothetical protein
MSAGIDRTRESVQEHLDEMRRLFAPDVKVTFIARLPCDGGSYMLVSDDTTAEVAQLVMRSLSKEFGTIAAPLAAGKSLSGLLSAFLDEVADEHARATAKFPDPGCSLAALTEEAGEVAKAMLDEPSDRVRKECVQLATMAARVALEGDPTMSGYRDRRGAGPHPIRVGDGQ